MEQRPGRARHARPRPGRHGDPLRPLRPAGRWSSRSEQGRAWDYENNGMVGAVADLIEAGRVKLYCVDSFDDRSLVGPRRCRWRSGPGATGPTSRWVTDRVVPLHRRTTRPARGELDRHRLQPRRLPRAPLRAHPRRPVPGRDLPVRQLRPRRLARVGRARRRGVLHQPDRLRPAPARRPPRLAARPAARGAHRRRGAVGDPPDRLAAVSARQMAGLLGGARGSPHELDVWGHDAAHDWPWWQRQLAHHLPRFC